MWAGGGGTADISDTESASRALPSTVIVGAPSVVESDKLPVIDVAPPLSRSELTRTPESALQLPRSPGNSPKCPESSPPDPGVRAPPLRLWRGSEASDSWSERQPPAANCLRACLVRRLEKYK